MVSKCHFNSNDSVDSSLKAADNCSDIVGHQIICEISMPSSLSLFTVNQV